MMKLRLAVHLHLHYISMWSEMKSYLANIKDYPYDLFVTLTVENTEIEKDIKSFKYDAKIWIVENRGYDVGPFVEFLHRIDLNDYDLIMKLHTKNGKKGPDTKLNGLYIRREFWKQFLIKSLIGTSKQFKKNIEQFKKNKQLGMVGSRCLIATESIDISNLTLPIIKEIIGLGFDVPKKITFVAGTMFISRATLLQPIKNKYNLTEFMPTSADVKDGTLAHIIERLFGCIIKEQGYQIKGYDQFSLKLILYNILRFVYSNKITKNNYHIIKILKIPVYRRQCNA